jgi:hypothetical protein
MYVPFVNQLDAHDDQDDTEAESNHWFLLLGETVAVSVIWIECELADSVAPTLFAGEWFVKAELVSDFVRELLGFGGFKRSLV